MQHRAQIEWEKLEKLTESFPKKFFFLSLEDWDEPSLEMKSLCDYGDTNHSLLEQNNEERDFLL